jgi:chemotaxis family two-component system response regulator Rcp1
MSTSEIHILLVEDNEGDIVLTLEALNDAKLRNQISVVRDGEQALEFLSKRGVFVDAKTPQLVLLDINLPRIDGKEVLQRIKTDPDLKKIPVVILTTSSSERDILEAYSNHANCYITKPVDLDKFISVIHSIEDFWISIVQLPKP